VSIFAYAPLTGAGRSEIVSIITTFAHRYGRGARTQPNLETSRMMPPLRRHLSFANLTSVMALMIALGGTSYAAITIPKNSVSSAQIKKSGVANSDLRANAVTSDKVKDGSLLAADFGANQLPAGPRGLTGPKGDPGLQGIPGVAGTTGPATVQHFQAAADLGDGLKASYEVYCPAGQQAIGGGVRGDDTASEATSVTSSRPAISASNTEPPANGQGFTGWRVTVTNLAGGVTTGIRPEVWVVCVTA
jgi:hypothetical protein